MDALFWLLLPVAAISGWVAATRHFKLLARKTSSSTYSSSIRTENVKGLIDSQPDKAVDIVINKVEVSPETIEVHLALGKLYRRSGEVNRAIRFHQNLSEKHALSSSQRESILFELGRDYLSAGLLDRAERIFRDLLSADEFKARSAKALIEVYQQENDWEMALEYAEMYEKLSGKSQKVLFGHYLCEKADRCSVDCANLEDKIATFKLALKRDKSCVRAYISLGDISFRALEYEEAVKYYMAAVDQDCAFLSVVFDNLVVSLQLIVKNEQLISVLPGGLSSNMEIDSKVTLLGKNTLSSKCKGPIKYIEQQVEKSPTISLLAKYLLLSLDDPTLTDRRIMSQVKNALFQINKQNASYKCISCGVGVHALHWQCPSCSSWSTIKPL